MTALLTYLITFLALSQLTIVLFTLLRTLLLWPTLLNFPIQCCFKYLLGWDYKKQQSSLQGGLFGHLQAFYGTTEYTKRGSLHGHFLLWLKGGANPTEIHHQLHDKDFQKHFFAFFEDIIQHRLPDIKTPTDLKFEPHVEQPPRPPLSNGVSDAELKEWESIFLTKVKKCGEILQ